MNTVKGVLVLALVFALSVPCFGSEVVIKRKKNKWISVVDQETFNQRADQESLKSFQLQA